MESMPIINSHLEVLASARISLRRLGYKVHEEPYVPNFDDGVKGPKLVPGLVLAIEPMVNLGTDEVYLADDGYTFITKDHKKSAHFEHTILITEGDAEILTV